MRNSLASQSLGRHTFTAEDEVQSLISELRSHKSHSQETNKPTKTYNPDPVLFSTVATLHLWLLSTSNVTNPN